MLCHGEFSVSSIIEKLVSLFETSIPLWSQSEIQKTGHKAHNNMESYNHYVNKFTGVIDTYFIRFTVTEMKAGKKVKRGTPGKNLIHSTAISDVTVYNTKQTAITNKVSGNNPVLSDSQPFIDTKLQQFFDSVKKAPDLEGKRPDAETSSQSAPSGAALVLRRG